MVFVGEISRARSRALRALARAWNHALRPCARSLALGAALSGTACGDAPERARTFDGWLTRDAAALDASGTVSSDAGAEVPDAAPFDGATALEAGADQDGGDAASAPEGDGGVTYHKHIRALMERSCRDCHTQGGVAPIPFDDWAGIKSAASLIAGAVAGGTMPPFGWNQSCQSLHDDPSINAEQRALFAAWKEAGFPEGKAADYTPPPPRAKKAMGEPTIVMEMSQAYTPPAKTDEYRCFLLGAIEDDTYLTGMEIIPGRRDEVHHVIIHRVEDAQLAQLRELEGADTKPGYLCSGGPGVSAQNMFSQRPGSDAVIFDTGDAAYLAGGSSIVIQVHYNTVFLSDKPTPDQTKIALWTLPAGQLPERVVYRTTTFGPINIPAGATNIISNISRPMSSLASLFGTIFGGGTFIPGEIIGTTPHAHQLATKMNASLKRADGTSACLNDVKWDFNWQLDYMFKTGIPYQPGDTFAASCTFDNGPANQPVINGVKQAPKAVAFGERSTDEMCEHYIWLRFPRDDFLRARGEI